MLPFTVLTISTVQLTKITASGRLLPQSERAAGRTVQRALCARRYAAGDPAQGGDHATVRPRAQHESPYVHFQPPTGDHAAVAVVSSTSHLRLLKSPAAPFVLRTSAAFRPFIDIQLKSFHKDDKKMATQWPPKQSPNGQSVPGSIPECSIQVRPSCSVFLHLSCSHF